ncbi:hypothetical protein [Dyadobacter sp. LHD-138]|uniref:toxin-antitoxin system YwqK family antitoxin n=1 Tax=Dyadobacter sp. LHD-138 TaxID=3071413 RepID=UPI0027E099B1|nr:hypothetical protein [Dyadobacter sp. LHD-138]MDQ6482179.1 hypothetical protein [Dyadobacter sp. LHD-138]
MMGTDSFIILLVWTVVGLSSCSQKKDSILKYHPNGALKSEEISINDSLSLYRSYFEDGVLQSSVHSINGFVSGRARHYFENGKLAQDWELKNGLPNGKCVRYYPSGNIFTIINYKDSVNVGDAYQYYDMQGKKIKYLTNYSIVHGKKWVNWQIQYDSLGNVKKTTTKIKEIIAPSEIKLGDSLKLEFYLEYPQYPKTKVYYGDYDEDFKLTDTSSIKGSYGSKNAVAIYIRPRKLGKETVRGILENYKVLDSLKTGFTKTEGKMIYWSYNYDVVK